MSKNYEEMSDGAINLEVHYLANNIQKHHAVIMTKDYCNNPSDAWPIIVSNEIDIIHNGIGCALATDRAIDLMKETDEVIFFQDENPLRAAMICFLMMKDNEQ